MPCWNWPFYEMLGNRKDVPINEFLDNLPNVFNANISRNFRTKNYQSFELGMNHLNDDDNYIMEKLHQIDEQFDLIILTEYYLESLVLLADILCVPYKVLFVKSRNHGSYDIEPLTDKQLKNFDTFFKQDRMLYKYFNDTLHAKIDVFGRDRMKTELSNIKSVFTLCTHNSSACTIPSIQPIKKKRLKLAKLTAAKYTEYMDANYGWCDNPANPYNKVKQIAYNGTFTVTCPFTDDHISKNLLDL